MGVGMKKLFFVLFGLCITTAGFADVLKVSESESEKGIVNQFDFNKFIRAMGFCSDDEPLLLANGDCVSCDYKPGKSESFDILIFRSDDNASYLPILSSDNQDKYLIQTTLSALNPHP